MAAALTLETIVACLGSQIERATHVLLDDRPHFSLHWPEFDLLLPTGGLPRGVVELSAQKGLGGATSVALAAVCAAQKKSPHTWAAWIDPEASLYAPGVAKAGVDLARLLVVRPPRSLLSRIAVKIATSHAFAAIVIDVDPIGGELSAESHESSKRDKPRDPSSSRRPRTSRPIPPEIFVRKLAICAEEGGSTILLLTDALRPRRVPWPVALRIELSRPDSKNIQLTVAKEKRGRIGLAKTIPFAPPRKEVNLQKAV